MNIKSLSLFTNQLEKEKSFYSETLGFELITNEPDKFSLNAGSSKLTFHQSEDAYIYHYCFLIPSNQLYKAKKWLEDRLSLIELGSQQFIQNWKTWNADSIYFYDASGNIVEFIVRYDLKNESIDDFTINQIISINEIGMATKNVEALNGQLAKEMSCKLWKGDLKRFTTNGDQNGLFLIPNYEIKKEWFPTKMRIEPSPFEAVVEIQGQYHSIVYKDETLKNSLISSI